MNKDAIFSIIEYELKLYNQLLNRFQAELKNMPKGSLNLKHVNNCTYFFQYKYNGHRNYLQHYIKKSNKLLLSKLMRKRFLILSIGQLKDNIVTLNTFLNTFVPYNPTDAINMLPKTYWELEPEHCNIDDKFTKWQHEDFESNKLFPEKLIHRTVGGLKVRSKSESIIAGLLEKENIPFRYEAALTISNNTIYPDFTVLRRRDNKIIYWEHFGMMDEEGYAQAAARKIALFLENKMFPCEQLITTYETRKNPIDAQNVQSIIDAFLT